MIINVRISIQKISNFNKIYFSASKLKKTTLLALQEKSLHVDQNILILYQIYGRVKCKNLWTLSPVIPRKCTNKKDWHYKFERHRLFNQKFTTKNYNLATHNQYKIGRNIYKTKNSPCAKYCQSMFYNYQYLHFLLRTLSPAQFSFMLFAKVYIYGL